MVYPAYEQQLACHVAEYLSQLDPAIKAVYRYPCACGGGPGSEGEIEWRPAIHLVVLTERRTAALISVLAALDRALSQALVDRCHTPQATHVLNVHVIDDADLRDQGRYAALFFPPRLQPVPIWRR